MYVHMMKQPSIGTFQYDEISVWSSPWSMYACVWISKLHTKDATVNICYMIWNGCSELILCFMRSKKCTASALRQSGSMCVTNQACVWMSGWCTDLDTKPLMLSFSAALDGRGASKSLILTHPAMPIPITTDPSMIPAGTQHAHAENQHWLQVYVLVEIYNWVCSELDLIYAICMKVQTSMAQFMDSHLHWPRHPMTTCKNMTERHISEKLVGEERWLKWSS